MNRFRPNILVEGCEPNAEDLWRDIKIGRFSFQGDKLCARCKIPTVNQETAIFGTEPTETLMKVRSGHVLRPNENYDTSKVFKPKFTQVQNHEFIKGSFSGFGKDSALIGWVHQRRDKEHHQRITDSSMGQLSSNTVQRR